MIKLKISCLCSVLFTLWYLKSTSLPKLFYRLQDRGDVSVHRLRKLEKAGIQVTKLTLDVNYFEKCLELGLCPKFLRFKPPKLSAYKNCKNVYRQVVNNQINCVKKDLKSAKSKYISELKSVSSLLSYVEKTAKQTCELNCMIVLRKVSKANL